MEMEFDPYYGPHGDYMMYYMICDGRYVDTNFKRITLKWFAYAYDFTYGYAVVGLGEKFNVIDIDGNLILKRMLQKVVILE